MDEALGALNPGLLTPAVLLGLAILLVFRGHLVPGPIFKTLVAEWHTRLAEKDKAIERWQAAYENERNARQVSDQQTAELLNLARTTNALLSGLPPARGSEGS